MCRFKLLTCPTAVAGREGVSAGNRGEIKIYCGWLHRLELRKVNNFFVFAATC